MNTHETMIEQIRRLNQEEAVKHELKKQAAINKIKQMREQMRQKEKGNGDTILTRTR